MKTLLFIFLGYIIYLIIWSIICLVSYYLSIAFHKKAFSSAILGLGMVVVYILSFLVGIGIFIQLISYLIHLEILKLILLFIFSGFISGIYHLLIMPFILIPSYFSEKLNDHFEKLEKEKEIDVLDEDGKSIAKNEGSGFLKRKVAKYFVLVYFLDIAGMLISNEEGNKFGDFIIMPAFRIGLWTLIALLVVGIYNLIRRRKFTPKNKAKIFINTMRIMLGFSVLMLLIIIVLDLTQ